jgi:hypothetical protein
MMVYLQKKDCKDCKKMINITFLNQEYIKKLNDNYISVVVNYEDKYSSYPIEMFYSIDFPALFFVNPKDESFIIDPLFGFVSPKEISSLPLFLPSIF